MTPIDLFEKSLEKQFHLAKVDSLPNGSLSSYTVLEPPMGTTLLLVLVTCSYYFYLSWSLELFFVYFILHTRLPSYKNLNAVKFAGIHPFKVKYVVR